MSPEVIGAVSMLGPSDYTEDFDGCSFVAASLALFMTVDSDGQEDSYATKHYPGD